MYTYVRVGLTIIYRNFPSHILQCACTSCGKTGLLQVQRSRNTFSHCMHIDHKFTTGLRHLTQPTPRTTKLNATRGSVYSTFSPPPLPLQSILECHTFLCHLSLNDNARDNTTSTTDHPSLRFTGVTSCYAWPLDETTTTLCIFVQ